MATFAFAGQHFGTLAAMSTSGILATSSGGWESIFYVFGGIGCVWCLLWFIIIRDNPGKDPCCSRVEREYIQHCLGQVEQKHAIRHPWKEILTSKAVWAICVAFFAENWGFYTMLTQLPTFLRDILKFPIEKSGIVSALPYLTMGVMLFVSGSLADFIQVKGYLTTVQVRKFFNCGAFICQTIFMILAAYLIHPTGSVACIVIAVGFGAFAWSGFSVNALDIAPNHASIIMGLATTCGSIPGIVSPLLTGFIVQNKVRFRTFFIYELFPGIASS